MAYGIRIRNASGSVQIDEKYKNFALRQKIITSATWNVDTSGYFWVAEVTTTNEMGLIAFNCASRVTHFDNFNNGDGTYNNRFVTPFLGGSPPAITFYVFGEPSVVPSGGRYGMVVRNPATGVIVFNDRDKFMRVRHVVSTLNVDITVPSGKVYATCIANPGKSRQIATIGGNRVRNDTQTGTVISGGVVNIAAMGMAQTLPPAASNMSNYTGTTQVLVIDVTDF